jgi:hypothetical protein
MSIIDLTKRRMNTLELKSKFHKLIDTIENEKILSSFYEILSSVSSHADGSLLARLSPEEREEPIEIEKEIQLNENLISHSEIKEKHRRWL